MARLKLLNYAPNKVSMGSSQSAALVWDKENGQAEISPDMAIRLEKAFGDSADHGFRSQTVYNFAEAGTCLGIEPLDKFRHVLPPVY